MLEDILNARGADELVVDKNIQNKFRDKDFHWMQKSAAIIKKIQPKN